MNCKPGASVAAREKLAAARVDLRNTRRAKVTIALEELHGRQLSRGAQEMLDACKGTVIWYVVVFAPSQRVRK